MKLITAVIKPEILTKVRDELTQLGVHGMTASEVQGYGSLHAAGFQPKVRIEIVVPADQVDDVVDAVCRGAFTGKAGDGKIWITPVDHVVRVRTGEADHDALWPARVRRWEGDVTSAAGSR
ncbi:P-II family nitrogen regulator [Corynebacterium yudongzhengii]|uniref:P-II family nitrogen regulator n=1 Tax=Corynebacterium yudongzhengii TaxID=2080740 RepID=A0A2U1T6E6_9CORY|nr:P-II family nitrogen regulator [Corynebacterium yudongzhengii]PWC01543.1 P-II family nitrogen regulator [Corynebacterium yudongzhengii]